LCHGVRPAGSDPFVTPQLARLADGDLLASAGDDGGMLPAQPALPLKSRDFH
jgi:hypothetical protein